MFFFTYLKVVIAASRVCHVKKHKAPVPMLSIHTFDGAKVRQPASLACVWLQIAFHTLAFQHLHLFHVLSTT